MKKKICMIMVIAMAMSVFACPLLVSAASPQKADAKKNKITSPATVKVNKVFSVKAIGDRSSVLEGTVEGETKFIAQSSDTRTGIFKNGKQYFQMSGGLLNVTHGKTSSPKACYLTIDKPGKYEIRVEFTGVEWDIIAPAYPNEGAWQYTDENHLISKYIQVQGKEIFKVTKGGKFAKNQTKSRWLNQGAKVGKLPKVIASKGYKFKGWYTKKSGGKKITKNTRVNFANNPTKTYYAQFKKK